MTYRISGPARRDLESIWLYTNTHWGAAQADAYIDALIARCAWLSRNQPLWRQRPALGKGIYSQLQGQHVILFQVRTEVIEIIRVLHSRMDPDHHLR